MQHCSGKGGALEEPATQAARQIGCTIGQAGDLERTCGDLTWRIQPVKPGREGEILKECEVIVEQRLMRKKANVASDATGGLVEGLTEYADFA